MTDQTSRDVTHRSREAEVLATFIELVDTLVSDYDVVEVLDHLVGTCVRVLDVFAAGVLLLDRRTGTLAVAASSSENGRLVEVFQVQHAQGPCLDCARSGEQVSSDDLARDRRWPGFAGLAPRAGCLSATALPLRWQGQRLGALGLFGASTGTLPEHDRVLAQAFADAAAIGLMHQQAARDGDAECRQLRSALDSRVMIEQAKGVLAERGQLSMKQAFELLRAHARHHNMKLAAVARDVVEGDLRLPS